MKVCPFSNTQLPEGCNVAERIAEKRGVIRSRVAISVGPGSTRI